MKKTLLTTFFAVCLTLTTMAQEKEAVKTPPEKTVSKEDKEAAKAKKEADLLEVFKIAAITPEEQAKMREFIVESGEYGKQLRADPDFTDEEKILKAKVYSKIKNARMKELLGDAKYKIYRDAVNAQKKRDTKSK
ncbi:hypothetical protein SAMN05443549_104290 [Flavobacterium fluvii]|uniref:LTXXQ motif family protein n=1 Tax=Flavobacterium fluvii TaxID=468056 RepID=A0A1M5KFV7_9FLAO|nr:hypothetical protein [Flavobacterium fluvii]SHG51379.1 hypothetical protein SAMN05443549_104290 [Flavobacterium fluvii]